MIKLPDIEFFYNDPQQMISDIKYTYESILGREIQQSSPEYIFIVSMAAWIMQQRMQFEAELKQNLLYYATGDKLDHIGALRETPRLDENGASTTLKFTLSAIQNTSITIPSGTRATADKCNIFCY